MISQYEIDIATGIRHDLFDAIQFDERGGKNNRVIGKQLGAQFIFKWIWFEGWKHYSTSMRTASKYKLHNSKSLFDDAAAWAEHAIGTRIALGLSLSHFAENKLLRLSCVNPHQSNKLYHVIDR